jgi:hypothetical protein
MKRMKVMLLVGLFALGSTFAEPSPETRAAAVKLMSLLEMDKNFDNSMQQAVKMQEGMVEQMDLSDAEKVEARQAMARSMKVALEKFSWEKMEGMFVDIYAEVFTTEELEGIIAFYETSAGKKFIAKQPELMAKTMEKMQTVMAELMPAIQQEAMKVHEEIKAKKMAE